MTRLDIIVMFVVSYAVGAWLLWEVPEAQDVLTVHLMAMVVVWATWGLWYYLWDIVIKHLRKDSNE